MMYSALDRRWMTFSARLILWTTIPSMCWLQEQERATSILAYTIHLSLDLSIRQSKYSTLHLNLYSMQLTDNTQPTHC